MLLALRGFGLGTDYVGLLWSKRHEVSFDVKGTLIQSASNILSLVSKAEEGR